MGYQMNRRSFLTGLAAGTAQLYNPTQVIRRTEHLILIVNGGARKKDYYETPSLCPNIQRIVSEGTVFEEDHCDNVASHETAFSELVYGLPAFSLVNSPRMVRSVMRSQLPHILVCRDLLHDVGHE